MNDFLAVDHQFLVFWWGLVKCLANEIIRFAFLFRADEIKSRNK